MLDTTHLMLAMTEYTAKLNKEKSKMKAASDENREQDRIVYYGNVRYLEGKIDLIKMIMDLYR